MAGELVTIYAAQAETRNGKATATGMAGAFIGSTPVENDYRTFQKRMGWDTYLNGEPIGMFDRLVSVVLDARKRDGAFCVTSYVEATDGSFWRWHTTQVGVGADHND